MGRRWTDKDVENLRQMARRLPAPVIAEVIDRTVGAVAFKAHQLKLHLPTRQDCSKVNQELQRKNRKISRNA